MYFSRYVCADYSDLYTQISKSTIIVDRGLYSHCGGNVNNGAAMPGSHKFHGGFPQTCAVTPYFFVLND